MTKQLTTQLTAYQITDALYAIQNTEEFDENTTIAEEEAFQAVIDWIEKYCIPSKLYVDVRRISTYSKTKKAKSKKKSTTIS